MQIRDLNVIPALHHHGGCRCQCITHGCDTWIKIKEYVPSQTQTEQCSHNARCSVQCNCAWKSLSKIADQRVLMISYLTYISRVCTLFQENKFQRLFHHSDWFSQDSKFHNKTFHSQYFKINSPYGLHTFVTT